MSNADRMEFIVATMTKDYEKARYIATKILKDEPDNTILQNYLSTFDKEEINRTMKKEIDEETDSTESAESSTGSDSDSSESTADEDNEETVIDAKTSCRNFVKRKTSYDSSNRHNTKDNVDKSSHNDFRGRMIRVLPIRLSDKISLSK